MPSNSDIPKDFLTFDVHRIYDPKNRTIGGKPIEESLVKALSEEAKYLETTVIWDIFVNVTKKDAIETMFYHSKNFEDVITGKAMLGALRNLMVLVATFKNKV